MPPNITSDYLAAQGLNTTIPAKFWRRVTKTNGCWLFDGGKHNRHWAIGVGRGTMGVHRISYILNVGPIPEGHQVHHNCPDGDRGDCVNPDHLWTGNQSSNLRDAISKGRWKTHFNGKTGELCPNSKLTWKQVIAIRANRRSYRELAMIYGVSKGTIGFIRRNETWKPENQPMHS